MTPILAFKKKVLDELLRDEKWRRKFDACKSMEQVKRVVLEFARERGYKIREVEI